MKRIDTLIVGGGQAGLAMSRELSLRGVDHLVLERGRVGERWRSERWDSLRLLTPNSQNHLPGMAAGDVDERGYMHKDELVRKLVAHARHHALPVEEGVSVRCIKRVEGGYRVLTDAGIWTARSVVLATGHCDLPAVPAMARSLSRDLHQVAPTGYRRPSDLPPGGVLVVGASATGVQLADELQRSGRRVTLAAGKHTRLPRHYRGKDILWWFEVMGLLDQPTRVAYDLGSAREQPSMQLVGRADQPILDLDHLRRQGVRLAGHLVGVDGDRVAFRQDLVKSAALSDRKLGRLLDQIDRFAESLGLDGMLPEAVRPAPVEVGPTPSELDLHARGIRSVLWATGYRRNYSWLNVPVLDARGEIVHEGGVTASPGLLVLGLPFMRRRNSTFIGGVGADAHELADELEVFLGLRRDSAPRAA